MYRRATEGWAKHWDFILLDTICLQVAYIIAYWVRFGTGRFVYCHEEYRIVGLWLALFSVMAAVLFNTMHTVLRRSLWQELRRTMAQCLLVFAAIIIFLFSKKDSESISRIIIYVMLGIYFVLSFTVRMLYKRFLIRHRRMRKKREMLLVALNREEAEKAIAQFNDRPEESINVCGVVLIENEEENAVIAGGRVVARPEETADYICTNWIDEVYIAAPEAALPEMLLAHCAEMGVTVHQELVQPTGLQREQRVEQIARRPVLTSSIRMAKPWQLMVKRVIDIVAGLLLSIPAALSIVVLTPIIKSLSSGPVLLKQERIGQHGKKFRMLSIRTMYMDAKRRMKNWREKYPDEKLTIKNDPRLIGNRILKDGTEKNGVGYWMRILSLDVLPQAFNVLCGQMSLVGTRAPSVEEWEKYQYHHRVRLACKPGITGLWQASGKSRTMSFEEATKLDTEYIANWSLGLDGRILFRTLGVEKRQKTED